MKTLEGNPQMNMLIPSSCLVFWIINTLTFFKPIWIAAACCCFHGVKLALAHSSGTASCAEPKAQASLRTPNT